MDDLVLEVFRSIATQGPLVGFLFYQYVENKKTIEAKDLRINALFDLLVGVQKETVVAVTNHSHQSQRIADALEDLKRSK